MGSRVRESLERNLLTIRGTGLNALEATFSLAGISTQGIKLRDSKLSEIVWLSLFAIFINKSLQSYLRKRPLRRLQVNAFPS